MKYFHPILCFFLPPIPPGGAFNSAPERKVPLGGFRGRSSVKESFRIGILIILQLFISFCLNGQSLNYPEIFGKDWDKAEEFISDNKGWITPMLKKYDVSYPEAIAVIFPELVRYSALRDKIEITLLKTLYINLGKDYANFSIGQFQMKPYFAEKIREACSGMPARKLRKIVSDSTGYDDMRLYRSAIVSDLEDVKMQISYLVLFMRICRDKFSIDKMDGLTRVKFLATAYNTGFYKTEAEILAMIDKKYYSTGLSAKEYYSYSDISVFWYRNNH